MTQFNQNTIQPFAKQFILPQPSRVRQFVSVFEKLAFPSVMQTATFMSTLIKAQMWNY